MKNKQTAMQLVDFSNPNADKIKSASTAKPMQNKQTAVEWLASKLGEHIIWEEKIIDLVEQAKQMEWQQIRDAYGQGTADEAGEIIDATKSAEQYYNKKYKSE